MRRALLLLVLAVGCASAGTKKSVCESLAQVSGFDGPVYAECALDARPRIVRYPTPNVQALLTSPTPVCFSADFDIVIAGSGTALAQTATLVRTNNQRYAEELKRVLSELTYTPPKKDGRAVAALVRYEGKLMARPPSGRAPPC
jgi:hypothetical protein